jgi:hypothetical protein
MAADSRFEARFGIIDVKFLSLWYADETRLDNKLLAPILKQWP